MNNYFSKEELYNILDSSSNIIGTDVVTYKILKLRNINNLANYNTYSVIVKHRILVAGSEWEPSSGYQTSGFTNYPILLNVQSGITSASETGTKIILKRIFPKTINANVEQSSNLSTGSSSSQTNQTSIGSSTSNINTFGVDLSLGFFGDLPVGSAGVQYSHSWENTNSQSASVAHGSSNNMQATSGNEMSVKDWSAYSSIQNFDGSSETFTGEFIQWNWGQTYPWNIFEFNETGSGSNILLPEDVVARLLYYGESSIGTTTKNILLPPSDLSLFGVDFTMAAEWQVTFPAELKSIETLQFQHLVNVFQASHSMEPGTSGSQATLQATLTTGNSNILSQTEPMDIGQYALVPLVEGRRSGMGIGFQTNLFDIAPAGATSTFKIRSRGNDVLVSGQGFSSGMAATFGSGYTGTGATINIGFKIVDVTVQYALLLKHWIGPGSGNIVLSISINGNQTLINVMDPEGQGSSNNLSQLELRNYDLKSPNYHDYLVQGWNEISVTVMPSDKAIASEYVIAALSVEA